MSERIRINEGMGVKPETPRPGFPTVEQTVAVDLRPLEGASLGTKPATPRPSFPQPQQQQQQQQEAPPPQNSSPKDSGK